MIPSLVSLLAVALGAVAAFFLQQRQWELRRRVEVREKRSEVARSLFDEISRLMDRRVYCLVQLYVWLKRGDQELIESALGNYRNVVRDWNYSLSRNVTMLHVFYDGQVRAEFEEGVGQRFVEAGGMVERFYRGARDADLEREIDTQIHELYVDVANFNLQMLRLMFLQENSAGLRADAPQLEQRLNTTPDVSKLISVDELHDQPAV